MGDAGVSWAVVVAAIAVIVNAAVSIGLHVRRSRFDEALATKKLDYDAALAQRKLRFDLFDKRFAVFDATRNFIGRALFLDKVEIEDDNAFLIATSGASFLFNDELGSYLKEVQRRAAEVQFVRSEREDAETEEESASARAKFVAERKWLREQAAVLEEKFKPFLELKE
jgi:hypothetical protein